MDACEVKLKSRECNTSSSSSSQDLLKEVYNETMNLLLFSSVHNNNLFYATTLCQKKVRVNFQKNGTSALHLAAQAGHTRIVELLLDYNANPNIQSNSLALNSD